MLARRPQSENIPHGLDALWNKAIGLAGSLSKNRRNYFRQTGLIVALEKDFRHLSGSKLSGLINQLHECFRCGHDTIEDRNQALAIVCEVAYRQIGLRPFAVQIAGALAIEEGCIAEMATGEGKTLVAAMSAVLAGWRGRGCHLVTANDYLARRDADWMKAIYRYCGLTVGYISQDMPPAERKQAYEADITYCTNKEVAADFLRDRLVLGKNQGLPAVLLAKMTRDRSGRVDRLVQRGLECAIVDEADAIFIDEAVTPLIISGDGPNQEHMEAIEQAAGLARELEPDTDYVIDRRYNEINLTRSGRQRLAELSTPLGGLWTGSRRREELIIQALTARAFYLRDKQYVIDNDRVVIVDEFTGRLMPDRTWRDGLHQAVEAKEGLEINLPDETRARISFQKFFRYYRKLSGMTGTAAEARTELFHVYRLPVVSIPTNRPCQREVRPQRLYKSASAKWEAVVNEICRVQATGRPVLIGTRNVSDSEHLSRLLTDIGLQHQVLNAVRQEFEADIIAEAGQMKRITVATNMAGRGTDICLGEGVAELGGLHVIATDRHEAGRIDRQLFGRSARQGDPGSARAFSSLEDELMQKYARPLSSCLSRFFRNGKTEISSRFWKYLVNRAQRRAERVSRHRRKDLLRSDKWIEEQLGFAGRPY